MLHLLPPQAPKMAAKAGAFPDASASTFSFPRPASILPSRWRGIGDGWFRCSASRHLPFPVRPRKHTKQDVAEKFKISIRLAGRTVAAVSGRVAHKGKMFRSFFNLPSLHVFNRTHGGTQNVGRFNQKFGQNFQAAKTGDLSHE